MSTCKRPASVIRAVISDADTNVLKVWMEKFLSFEVDGHGKAEVCSCILKMYTVQIGEVCCLALIHMVATVSL